MTPPRLDDLPLVSPLPATLTPEVALRRLAGLPHVVLFDSAQRVGELGRFSFLAADPFRWYEAPADGSPALNLLEADLLRYRTTPDPSLPPFQGGAAGLFGYELGRSLERVSAARHDEFECPALAVGIYDVALAWDHATGASWLVSQGFPECDPPAGRQRAEKRLRQFQAWLNDGVESEWLSEKGGRGSCRAIEVPNPSTFPAQQELRPPIGGPFRTASEKQSDAAVRQLAPQWPATNDGTLTSNFSRDDYLAAVGRVVEYIRAGDAFQVNLSQRLLHPADCSSVELYLRLRERNPAPFAGFFDVGGLQICSASPERFVSVRNGAVESRPIKGTRQRTRRPEADLYAGDELRASAKDRAENVMIVDLMRNDLSRVCKPDSVCVTQLCGLENYAYVQHLVSVVEGQLEPQYGPLDLICAAFPGGSVTGAPKVRAMEIIAELEPTARGAYCGSLGYIGFDGTMDSSILIRTITAGRGWWQIPVGGGIVAASDPAAEYEETWHKATGMVRALTR